MLVKLCHSKMFNLIKHSIIRLMFKKLLGKLKNIHNLLGCGWPFV